ncbi:hypothetical protein ACLI4Q_15925 [Natrialbaceae archaeon A-CW1-1]
MNDTVVVERRFCGKGRGFRWRLRLFRSENVSSENKSDKETEYGDGTEHE